MSQFVDSSRFLVHMHHTLCSILHTQRVDASQFALADFSRAATHYRQACYAQSVQHYLAGLKIDPTRAEVYADLAKAYEMLGCWNQALTALEVALRLRPDFPAAVRRKKRILDEKEIYSTLTSDLEPNVLGEDTSDARFFLQHQPVHPDAGVSLTIERQSFTLTYPKTTPRKLLLVLCQLIERTREKVGQILRCYPRQQVPVSMETAHQNIDLSSSVSLAPLPRWAAACYDGGIRLAYRPYGDDSGIGILYAALRHEWVHLLVDLLTQRRCPQWLDEGLAQTIARPLIDAEKELLQQAIQEQRILPFHKLCKPFSHIAKEQRRLAYLQSRAITEYLVDGFGFFHIREFLRRIDTEKASDTVFREVFGKREMEIAEAWRMAASNMNAGRVSELYAA